MTADRCLQMAEAADRDADSFWPNAPLHALERREAAKVWREMAESLDSDVLLDIPVDPVAVAEILEQRADLNWAAGLEIDAVKARIGAATWRRIARISEGEQS